MPLTGSRRRWVWIGGAPGLIPLLVVGVIVLLFGAGCASDDGPAERFETAAKAFHGTYDPLIEQLTSDLSGSGGSVGDPAHNSAVSAANQLVDAFDAYDNAINAIQFPDDAKTAVADLGKAIEAGRFVVVNVSGSFTTSEMKALTDQFQPKIESALADREKALRTVLGTE